MKPKLQSRDKNRDLFREELIDILDMSHNLCVTADLLDWSLFRESFDKEFPSKTGRPATPSRLIAGLLYLKALYNLSDKQLVRTWVENPYWQYFCGEQYFQHKFPLNSSVLSKWRKRIGAEGMERLLLGMLDVAKREGLLDKRELLRVNIDTTVQEKYVRHPLDSQLYYRSRCQLVDLAAKYFIPLRQSYRFKAKEALFRAQGYGHAKQYRRMHKQVKVLKNYLGRVCRDIERYCTQTQFVAEDLMQALCHANRLLSQQKRDKNKLYSLHAPEVECISKGKARKRYEFGVKVSFVTTSKQGWVLAAKALHGNPHDGHTLSESIDAAIKNTGVMPEYGFVDRGYRGHSETRLQVFMSGQRRGVTKSIKRWLKRRSAIEPVIGHMKQSHGLATNRLKGKVGDQINALSAAIGYNFALLLNKLSPT